MKVICIKEGFYSEKENRPIPIHPVVGEVVTVIRTTSYGFYYLSEYPTNGFSESGIAVWNHKKFAPLSDIDETEFIREYNTEKV